jgi:hypothetical protein
MTATSAAEPVLSLFASKLLLTTRDKDFAGGLSRLHGLYLVNPTREVLATTVEREKGSDN